MLKQENKDLIMYSKILDKLLLYLDKHRDYLNRYSLVRPYKLAKKIAYKYDKADTLSCTYTGNSISTPDWGSGDWINVGGDCTTLPYGTIIVKPKNMAIFTNKQCKIKSFGDVKFLSKRNIHGEYISMDIGACYPSDNDIVLQFIGYIHALQRVIKHTIQLNKKQMKENNRERAKKHVIDTKYSWHNIFKDAL